MGFDGEADGAGAEGEASVFVCEQSLFGTCAEYGEIVLGDLEGLRDGSEEETTLRR
jgi:hypothetical protein